MPTAGNNITKTETYAGLGGLRDAYNANTWNSSSHPFNPGASNDYGSVNPAGGSAAGEYSGVDLTQYNGDVNVGAATILQNFRDVSSVLSRIRNCRLIRWYNTNGSNGVTYDQTAVTSTGRAAWQANMNGVAVSTVGTDNVVDAAGINNFVNNLSAAINANRVSTLTFNEYYCHSSCHSSCHGSI